MLYSLGIYLDACLLGHTHTHTATTNSNKSIVQAKSVTNWTFDPWLLVFWDSGCVQNGIFFLFTTVHTAAALQYYILLHAGCIHLGHTTSSSNCALNFDPPAHICLSLLHEICSIDKKYVIWKPAYVLLTLLCNKTRQRRRQPTNNYSTRVKINMNIKWIERE